MSAESHVHQHSLLLVLIYGSMETSGCSSKATESQRWQRTSSWASIAFVVSFVGRAFLGTLRKLQRVIVAATIFGPKLALKLLRLFRLFEHLAKSRRH
jgi:hypothetical protein